MATKLTAPALLHSHRLDNGLTVFIVPRPGCGVVTTDMWVSVGSADEPPELNGASHFLEHMLFKGTERRGVGEIDRTVESLGGYLNAGTSHDFTHYYIMAAAEHFPMLVDILADVLCHSTLDAGELDRERQVILEEYRRKQDDPHGFLWDTLYEEAFAAGPYKASVLGEPATLEAITREKMLDYYHRLYCPANMALIVVGDVDPTAALSVIAQAMKGFDREPRPLVARDHWTTAYAPGVLRLFDRDVHETYGVLAFPAPALTDPAETYAIDALQFVLGGGDASVLYQEIQEKRRLATSIHAGCANSRHPDLFYIFYTCEDAKREALEAAVLEQIETLRTTLVTPRAMERARKLLVNSHAFSLETTSGQSGSVGYYHCVTGSTDFEWRYAEGIRAVTAEQVMEQARRWLNPESRMHVAVRASEGAPA